MDEVASVTAHCGTQPLSLEVDRLEVDEAIGELTRIRVNGTTADEVDVQPLVGSEWSFVARSRNGLERTWWGSVRTAEAMAHRPNENGLSMSLVPRHGRLALGAASQVFTDISAIDAIEQILEAAGLLEQWATHVDVPPSARSHIHQYRESDLEFIFRLLREEGLAWIFDHDAAGVRLCAFDSVRGLSNAEQPPFVVTYRPEGLGDLRTVHTLSEHQRVTTSAVSVWDHRDDGEVLSSASQADADRTWRLHPSCDAGARTDALRRVQRQAQGLLRQRRSLSCSTDAFELSPVRSTTILSHPRPQLGEAFVVESVAHRLVRETSGVFSYRNTAELFSSAFAIAPRPFPPPAFGGLTVGHVRTEGTNDRDSDRLGRVHVEYVWDRDARTRERPSAPLRVTQPMFSRPLLLPRRQFQVLLVRAHGHLSRFEVAGQMFSASDRPPYSLPEARAAGGWQSDTFSEGPRANEIRWDDSARAEELMFYASRDALTRVLGERIERVAGDDISSVGLGAHRSIQGSLQRSVEADQVTSVRRDLQWQLHRSLTARVDAQLDSSTNSSVFDVKGNLVETTAQSWQRTVGRLDVLAVLGPRQQYVLGNVSQRWEGGRLARFGGNHTVRAGGELNHQVGALDRAESQTYSATSGADHVLQVQSLDATVSEGMLQQAQDSLRIVGGAGVEWAAGTIQLVAEDELVLSSSSIEIALTASGRITIRAPTIQLVNAASFQGQVEVN